MNLNECKGSFLFNPVSTRLLTVNRPGFLESSTAGGEGRILPPCVISLFED